jgi:6-phosphogluconolactonase
MDVIDENHSGEVVIDPNGKFLYDSNRGPDTIAVLSIDATKGTLALVEQAPTRGLMPRNFEIDPTGSYLFAANQASDDVVLFRIQDKTGRILPSRTVLKVDTPVCVRFMPVE